MYSGGTGHLLESKVAPLYVQGCFLKSEVPDEGLTTAEKTPPHFRGGGTRGRREDAVIDEF